MSVLAPVAYDHRTSIKVACQLLSEVGTRWAHTMCVAEQARRAAWLLNDAAADDVVDAAWLHDVGYAPALATTGFHPLDGARWLREQGWRPEVTSLVAWHSLAGTEADLRNLGDELRGYFASPCPSTAAILTWADMTSSPLGHLCSVADRVEDILDRYPPGSPVHRSVTRNARRLFAEVADVERRLSEA